MDKSEKDWYGNFKINKFYIPYKDFENKIIFNTLDHGHLCVLKLKSQEAINIASYVQIFYEGLLPNIFDDLYIKPERSRKIFQDLKWQRVAAFQTRNSTQRSFGKMY